MSRVVTHSETFTGYPVSYDTTDYAYRTYSNPTNAYTSSSDTTYAQAYIVNGANAESWLYYKFDTSSIPDGATITSVSCKAKCAASGNSTNTPTKWMCFFSGTTQKGTPYNLGTSTKIRTLTLNSGITLSDLRDARVKVYVKRGTSNTGTSYYIRFYGATLTVHYTYNENYYTVTTSSSARGVTLSPTSQEYAEGADADVTIAGDMTDVTVTDNNVDVTSQVTTTGDSHLYSILSITADHNVIASGGIQGQTIFIKQNDSWISVDQVYIKQNGTWNPVDTLHLKENGTWKS